LIQGEQWNRGYFNREAFEIDSVIARFGSRCFLRPVLRPGDLIISSNWILHGSYRTAAMRKGRSSVEVRFIGDKRDPGPSIAGCKFTPYDLIPKVRPRRARSAKLAARLRAGRRILLQPLLSLLFGRT